MENIIDSHYATPLPKNIFLFMKGTPYMVSFSYGIIMKKRRVSVWQEQKKKSLSMRKSKNTRA